MWNPLRIMAALTGLGLTGCNTPPSPPLFSKGLRPITNATVDGISPSADACASCHKETHQEWSTSRHAASFTNPNFRHSVTESYVKQWCLNCHQPLRTSQNEKGTAVNDGVSCAVCHIRNNTLWVTKPLSDRGKQKHPTAVVTSSLSSSEFCAGCHQFSGPTQAHPITFGGDPIQNTWNEWSASTDPKPTCQDCHMPKGQHTFLGGHDIATVNRALAIDLSKTTLTLSTTKAVRHAVPTGDPFRRLELRICGETCDKPLLRRTFSIAHTYMDGVMRVTTDTRLQAPGQPGDSVTVPLPKHAQRWELEYFYADPRLTAHLPSEEVSASIRSGLIPAAAAPINVLDD